MTLIEVEPGTRCKLKAFKHAQGFHNYNDAIVHLLEKAKTQQPTQESKEQPTTGVEEFAL